MQRCKMNASNLNDESEYIVSWTWMMMEAMRKEGESNVIVIVVLLLICIAKG